MDIPRPLLKRTGWSLDLYIEGWVRIWPVTEEEGHHGIFFFFKFLHQAILLFLHDLPGLAIDTSERDHPFHALQTFSTQYSFTTCLAFTSGVQVGVAGGGREWRNLETEILSSLRRGQQEVLLPMNRTFYLLTWALSALMLLSDSIDMTFQKPLQLLPQFMPLYRRMENNWLTRMLGN